MFLPPHTFSLSGTCRISPLVMEVTWPSNSSTIPRNVIIVKLNPLGKAPDPQIDVTRACSTIYATSINHSLSASVVSCRFCSFIVNVWFVSAEDYRLKTNPLSMLWFVRLYHTYIPLPTLSVYANTRLFPAFAQLSNVNNMVAQTY